MVLLAVPLVLVVPMVLHPLVLLAVSLVLRLLLGLFLLPAVLGPLVSSNTVKSLV